MVDHANIRSDQDLCLESTGIQLAKLATSAKAKLTNLMKKMRDNKAIQAEGIK